MGENLLTFQNTIITANLTDPIEMIVTNQFEFAGFEDSDQAEIVTDSSAFSTYNLAGPVTATGNPGFHSGYEFATSAGSLFLNGTTGDSTFTAVTSNTAVTPKPSTITMVGSSLLLGLAGMVRRRMRQV